MSTLIQAIEDTPLPATVEAAWLRELPAARRTELQGWQDVPARHRSLLGSRLLREGLRQLGFPAGALASLRYAAHGKPTLDLPVAFSLAHCEGRILCAISTAGPIGVDVEPVAALRAAEFRNYLSDEERDWAGDDPERFCALWTKKEAIVKAAGTRGLAAMRDVRIKDWHTTPVFVGPGYCAHVAQATPFTAAPDVRRCTLQELLTPASPPSDISASDGGASSRARDTGGCVPPSA